MSDDTNGADAVLALQQNIDDRVVEALIRVLQTRYDHQTIDLAREIARHIELTRSFSTSSGYSYWYPQGTTWQVGVS